jgi:2-dehydro-3-deoxyphosphogluconate aldolase / (4S)-4-hydroxy-2-oxoglutarate aldolase
MNIIEFKQLPLLGILRGIEQGQLPSLIEAIVASGLKTIEITMNTPNAPELIHAAVRLSQNRLTIGAGTVLGMESLRAALTSGASFIVMPTVVDDVAMHCLENKIPFFPGALTPQEIFTAWQTSPAMVKVFPAKFFGPDYFKEIKGPFKEIELLACGGVTPENLADFARCGASAFALGGSVFKKEWLQAGEFGKITDLIKQYVTAYQNI